MDTDLMIDIEVDAKGLACPLPILRAKKALSTIQSGHLMRVIATDPGSVRDFQAFSRKTGNELVSQTQGNDGAWAHVLRRK